MKKAKKDEGQGEEPDEATEIKTLMEQEKERRL